jgi:hypothetical protein
MPIMAAETITTSRNPGSSVFAANMPTNAPSTGTTTAARHVAFGPKGLVNRIRATAVDRKSRKWRYSTSWMSSIAPRASGTATRAAGHPPASS